MDIPYYNFTNNDMLFEITKWHIIPYIHFPEIFLEKLCKYDNPRIIQWLLADKYVTIDTLNKYVKYIENNR